MKKQEFNEISERLLNEIVNAASVALSRDHGGNLPDDMDAAIDAKVESMISFLIEFAARNAD